MTRRHLLRGDEDGLRAALDRVHFGCEVRGVLERDGEFEVWTADGAPLPAFDDLGVTCEVLAVDDREWTGLEDDAAVLVAPDLLVRPPWVARPPDFRGIELVVPRGMAFGSGEHGSTQAALCALREVFPAPPPDVCADVGTGSGILALYARARGARRILACDVEAESVAAARELLEDADVRVGGPEAFAAGSADLVIANLDARQLDAALASIVALWSRRGPLVLSGMRPDEVDPLAARVPAGRSLRVEREGFVAVAFTGS